MKKRATCLMLISLFSLSLLTGCNSSGGSTSGEDDMFDDDIGKDDDQKEKFTFKSDGWTAYPIDNSVSNENGSMSYEIFVRSFYDSNNDGIGDFRGVASKLDYLKDMGIKTVWLMPIHPSPTYHGYDVTDYYAVNPDYGTMDDFDYLVEEAGKRHIDIMLDMVLNHSSDQHQWFKKSLEDFANQNADEDSKADWYVWSVGQGKDYKIYNGQAYTYEAGFGASMPDFNLDSTAVRAEMEKITKHWIDHGVKGFRLDAVKYYYPAETGSIEFMDWLEDTAHKYDSNFYMVGECWTSQQIVQRYHKSKLDSFFNFNSSREGSGADGLIPLIKRITNGNNFGNAIEQNEKIIKQNNPNAYSSYFFSNHDMDRVSNSLTEEYASTAINVLATMPGTPFLYYGEEILLKGERQGADSSDARRRLPMIWSKNDKTGECEFPEKNRPDLSTNDQVKDGVADQLSKPFSVLNAYRYAINVRNKYPIFKHGVFTNITESLKADDKRLVGYKLSTGDNSTAVVVIHNLSLFAATMDMPGGMKIAEQLNPNRKLSEVDEQGKLHIYGGNSVILTYNQDYSL